MSPVSLGALVPWSEIQSALTVSLRDSHRAKAALVVGGSAVILWATPVREGLLRTVELIGALWPSRHSGRIHEYNGMHDAESSDARKQAYSTLVDSYYDLATAFYEWGWGDCFHFAYRYKAESWREAFKRHEQYLASKLQPPPGGLVLDAGCGVGGPARVISRFLGCSIKGVTINEYQVNRGNQLNKRAGLDQQVKLVQGDFMKLPFQDGEFDGVYAIESTCHAPHRKGVYSEIFRVLKPGGVFATYEWGLTDKYNPESEAHRQLKKQIEIGDGLPDLIPTSEITQALRDAGFEVVEARDYALDSSSTDCEPWYGPLLASWNPLKWPCFQFNPVMNTLLPIVLRSLEMCRILPADASTTRAMLEVAALGCRAGGLTGSFTPMWLMVARKPTK
mmetsp:Transcript_72760/g.135957  ORF Transcript_72760/g.135957 Transcript_72760/m.135957 type:complete len:392 (+) Transcript_72760:77-1252(+)